MKPVIVGFLFTLAIPVSAQEIPTKEYIYDRITYYSSLYGVSEGVMTHIATAESSLNPLAVGDRHLIAPDGLPHKSIGLVQINKYWNPGITEEQAFNVEFSLEFLAKNLRDGRCYLWSTCPLKK